MDDNNQTPPAVPGDDLLDWMPPELIERARQYEARDANTAPPPKTKRINYTVPPEGKHRMFSLAALIGGALLLLLGTCFSALGSRGTQALLEKGRLWFALWLTSQTATLCLYLLCLLPLRKKMRRPALILSLGVGLFFGLGASLTVMLHGDRGDASLAFEIATVVISVLAAMAFSPNPWLIIGVLRRKTTEKFSVLMGGLNLAVILIGLISALAGGKTDFSTMTTALNFFQGLCFLSLLASWPVLDRAVLEKN